MHKVSVQQNFTNLISLKMGLLLFLQEKKKNNLIFGVSLIIITYMLVAYEPCSWNCSISFLLKKCINIFQKNPQVEMNWSKQIDQTDFWLNKNILILFNKHEIWFLKDNWSWMHPSIPPYSYCIWLSHHSVTAYTVLRSKLTEAR